MKKKVNNIKPSRVVRKSFSFLSRLSELRSHPKLLRKCIQSANTSELLTLVEIALNILRNRVPLRAVEINRLRRHASIVRALSRTRTPQGARQILLAPQIGKGIPAIAGLLASSVLPILTELLFRKPS